MTETIRYYFLQGRATYVTAGTETPLSNEEFHDFILNKKQKMRCVQDDAMKHHRQCQDYTST
jgi:hypothetical protein